MIPFYRHCCGEAEIAAAARVLRSDWLTMGPEVEAFEREAAEVLGTPSGWQCLAVSSCTSGLYLLAKLLTLGGRLSGPNVAVPNLTFAATYNAMQAAGARPVRTDVDEDGYLDLEKIKPDVSTAVIVTFGGLIKPANPKYGHPCQIVWDQAHSFQPGAFLPFSAWSFFPTKNITAGEGGLISVPDELADEAKARRNHGRSSTYEIGVWGSLNLRMTDLQAAILREQLKRLPWIIERKAEIAAMYRSGLAGSGLKMPPEGVTHLFWVRSLYRNQLQARLKAVGIETSIHYRPLSLLVANAETLPVSERISRETLSLPFYPGLADAEVHEVIEQTLIALETIGD